MHCYAKRTHCYTYKHTCWLHLIKVRIRIYCCPHSYTYTCQGFGFKCIELDAMLMPSAWWWWVNPTKSTDLFRTKTIRDFIRSYQSYWRWTPFKVVISLIESIQYWKWRWKNFNQTASDNKVWRKKNRKAHLTISFAIAHGTFVVSTLLLM